MFVCRCCLTFEDNLYPFDDYQLSFLELTGITAEKSALICPICIRKLTEACAFRDLSLKSDDILQKQLTEVSLAEVKTEALVEEEQEIEYIIEECEDENFQKPGEELSTVEEGEVIENIDISKDLLHELIEAKSEKKRSKRLSDEKQKREISMVHSMRAKAAWTKGAKENLIKECPYCFLSGISKVDLMHHIQEHIILNGGLECDHCSKKWMKKRQLKRHIQRVYLGLKDGVPISDGLTLTSTCIICHETFPRKSLLRIHYKERHPEIIEAKAAATTFYTCQDCGKQLKTKKTLENHELTHSELRPYVCSVCGREYKTKEGLKYHEMTHTNLRPYLCPICGKSFKTKDNLRDHEPVHTGNFDFPCEHCDKKFRSRALLLGHRVLHDETPRHTCEICGLKFRRANNLRDHKLTHTETRLFSCGHCGTSFKSRSSLKRHMKQHAVKMGMDDGSIEYRRSMTVSGSSGYLVEGFIVHETQVVQMAS